jgi:hypothetical protein
LAQSGAAEGHRIPESGEPVLREQLGTKRLRFNDEQRRRLAVKGKELA